MVIYIIDIHYTCTIFCSIEKPCRRTQAVQKPEALAGDRQQTVPNAIVCSHSPKTPLRHVVLPTVLRGLQVGTSHSTSALLRLIPDGSHVAGGGGKTES